MILIETSVLVDALKDGRGRRREKLRAVVPNEQTVLSRFTQLELLQGARDEEDWAYLSSFLDRQDYLETQPATWPDASRIYYELRRKGKTVRSIIDCVIAQLCLENRVTVVHNDRDYETIASIRPLQQRRIALTGG